MLKRGWVALIGAAVVALAIPAVGQGATRALVNTDSPSTPFPQNKQNEPAVAIDPMHPNIAVAGSNDEIDEPKCGGNECPFTQGIGNSGVYFSFNGGTSWSQPTYQGFSGRSGTGVGDTGCNGCGPGPIGTVPKYFEQGLVSDGDPGVAFGPAPRPDGSFSWSNGSRLYYSNLASNFNTRRKDFTFKGVESIAVSHVDNVEAAAAGGAAGKAAWHRPVVVTSQNQSSSTFSDKPAIGVDNAATSPFFGNAYVCYSRFQSIGSEPVAIHVTRSTDGGNTWAKPQRLTPSFDSPAQPGRQGCSVATDSHGVVYLVWEDTQHHQSVFLMDRSFDGGKTFEKKPRVVANVTDVGQFDNVRSISFDGIAGARTSSFPSLDIANGTPTGIGAPNTLALGWSDGRQGLNNEHALVKLSSNRGNTWTVPRRMERRVDRPDFAFLSLSPDGRDLYVVYDGFTDPFRDNTTAPRRFAGVVRHADVSGTSLSNRTTLHHGAVGDARASSANSLIDEFIGDYNTVDSTNADALAVYNDASNAAVCPAMNVFRQATVDGTAGDAPAPGTDCPPTFGNTDIYSAASADPTTP